MIRPYSSRLPIIALAALALLYCGTTSAQTQASLKVYEDKADGVTFRYPADWQLDQEYPSYFGSSILLPTEGAQQEENPKTTAAVVLEGRDSDTGTYRQTNFIDAAFLFRAAPGLDQKQCYSIPHGANENDQWKTKWTTIHDIRYLHGTGFNTGLCNKTSEDVYATFQHGKCLLFEKQVNSICPNSEPRDITLQESAAIDASIDQVMHSVRIAKINHKKAR